MLGPKPFKKYEELASLLESRGMLIEDKGRAIRKLMQIGYYRFTGYSYHFREYKLDENGRILYQNKMPVRKEKFFSGTSFNKVFELYLLDKKLRVALFDAIERIEIYVRSVIAHEMGQYSELAYQEEKFIDKKFIEKGDRWEQWQNSHKKHLGDSKLDCIRWHRDTEKAIPIWVAIEAWDFGLLSNYFSMLKGRYKNDITKRIGKDILPVHLQSWLYAINIIRNKCAHHDRIWNMNIRNDLSFPTEKPFDAIDWSNSKGKSRLYGLIIAIWYLVRQIGKNSKWINSVAEIVDNLPDLPACSKMTMGFPSKDTPAIKQLGLTSNETV